MENKNYNILVVDNEEGIRHSVARVLEKAGHTVSQAKNGRQALDILAEGHFALIISDKNMPHMDGIELLRTVKKEYPVIEFIIITGHGSIEDAVKAMRMGAYDFITKPFKKDELLQLTVKALERYQLTIENRRLRQQLQTIQNDRYNFIGHSEAARHIKSLITRIAPTPSNVLITGGSGTGKEVIARLIHSHSDRADKSFVAINCGAISENLIESELFGHVRGSFTGAIRDKEGIFTVAGDGTLFLDEISTIPVNLQVKLLRVLEEHEVQPVGATRSYPVKARIIAATNRDLRQEISEGRFREDLYFRLNVIEIDVPPLSERSDDIPLLVTYFIKKMNRELNKNVQGADAEVLHLLQSYNWPGNVRELENVIERAMIFCDGEILGVDHLPSFFIDQNNEPLGLKAAVHYFERKHILSVLRITRGDKKEAARLLKVGVSSLYRKMAELDIDDSAIGSVE
ncbi:MAG TPA: sigma-54-dependent Fis family transcriptional regulator [Caldithrix abyssi]|uniref:Sigma-54-dependent Fis family transcriptional regulator n=1 Tax=Caldithrix abyssi TaxID=187145 RepID=A0A7V5RRR9_CALAY|nr:sigma-54-dependent Fis family transcriptional regulator [Caldithrix abyssi]